MDHWNHSKIVTTAKQHGPARISTKRGPEHTKKCNWQTKAMNSITTAIKRNTKSRITMNIDINHTKIHENQLQTN